MQWDFWSLSPEAPHQVTCLMSDRGIPRTCRHMNGYGSHTFLWVNAGGERSWMKYHFKTDQGMENFTDAEAGDDCRPGPGLPPADLRNAIDGGDPPSWTLEVQIMPFEDAPHYRFNPFDLTKVWPHGDYPLNEVGRMVLDRNPANYFAEIEQAAFEPANMVPGIGPRPDKMLLGGSSATPMPTATGSARTTRSCRSTARTRRSIATTRTARCATNTPGTRSTRRTPTAARRPMWGTSVKPAGWATEAGEMVREAYTLHPEDDDFGQPGTLVREIMSQTDRDNLVTNILGHASDPDVTVEMKPRIVQYWTNVDHDIGAAVAAGPRRRVAGTGTGREDGDQRSAATRRTERGCPRRTDRTRCGSLGRCGDRFR